MKKAITILTAIILLGSTLVAPVSAAPIENYTGKTVSIMGDSISTFEGYIPKGDGVNLNHMSTYPDDTLRLTVEDTWWMQVIDQLGAKLGVNESWAGTRVYNVSTRNSGTDGKDICMPSITRIKNLGSNGTPDVILFYGGTNDVGKHSELGSFDAATAPTEVDLDAIVWDDFAQAYVAAIMRMQHFYPDAEIFALLPNRTEYHDAESFGPYIEVMEAICDHYGVQTVDLRDSGIKVMHLPDGTHPDAVGMDLITAEVLKTMTHTHIFKAADDQAHICDCGKASMHNLTVTTGILGSETKECTVCSFSQTNNTPIIIVSVSAAAIILIVLLAVVIIIKRRKK